MRRRLLKLSAGVIAASLAFAGIAAADEVESDVVTSSGVGQNNAVDKRSGTDITYWVLAQKEPGSGTVDCDAAASAVLRITVNKAIELSSPSAPASTVEGDNRYIDLTLSQCGDEDEGTQYEVTFAATASTAYGSYPVTHVKRPGFPTDIDLDNKLNFSLLVKDLTAPVLTVPADINEPATSASGREVEFTASATDNVAVQNIICEEAGVNLSGASLVTTAAGKERTFTNTFPEGVHTITCKASDGQTPPNSHSRTFTITITEESGGGGGDDTPPTSSASGTLPGPVPYTFGNWTNQDVTVTLSGSDLGGSGLKEIRYTTNGDIPSASTGTVYGTPLVISTEGTTTVKFIAIDNDGNVESPVNSAVVKIDKTAPVVTPGDVSDTTWRNTNLSQDFTADDPSPPGSGLSNTADATFTLTASENSTLDVNDVPVPTVVSKTVFDSAGNSTVRSVSALIDKVPPSVVCHTAPTYILNQSSPADVTATATDALSGPAATPVAAAPNVSSVGSKTVSVTGYDTAGNSTSVNCAYQVIFDWDGFFAPVDNLPTLNVVKAGSAVPVKFSLGGDQGLAIMATGYPTSNVAACDAAAGDDAIEETVTAGNSSLSYDSVTGRYNYVWKTDKGWAGQCRQLRVKLTDGTIHAANFKLTK